nr:hypothetical protein [uncultured Actinotalea sp.]
MGEVAVGDLRALIAQGDHASLLDAVDVALERSVQAVRRELDYAFLDAHAEEATAFFRLWLARSSAFERMAVATWVSGELLTSMVHVGHAYGIAARVCLEALEGAARATAEALDEFQVFADGPDAEIDEATAGRVAALASRVRDVRDGVAVELANLPDVPEGHGE